LLSSSTAQGRAFSFSLHHEFKFLSGGEILARTRACARVNAVVFLKVLKVLGSRKPALALHLRR
jgi:hypothetical protein